MFLSRIRRGPWLLSRKLVVDWRQHVERENNHTIAKKWIPQLFTSESIGISGKGANSLVTGGNDELSYATGVPPLSRALIHDLTAFLLATDDLENLSSLYSGVRDTAPHNFFDISLPESSDASYAQRCPLTANEYNSLLRILVYRRDVEQAQAMLETMNKSLPHPDDNETTAILIMAQHHWGVKDRFRRMMELVEGHYKFCDTNTSNLRNGLHPLTTIEYPDMDFAADKLPQHEHANPAIVTSPLLAALLAALSLGSEGAIASLLVAICMRSVGAQLGNWELASLATAVIRDTHQTPAINILLAKPTNINCQPGELLLSEIDTRILTICGDSEILDPEASVALQRIWSTLLPLITASKSQKQNSTQNYHTMNSKVYVGAFVSMSDKSMADDVLRGIFSEAHRCDPLVARWRSALAPSIPGKLHPPVSSFSAAIPIYHTAMLVLSMLQSRTSAVNLLHDVLARLKGFEVSGEAIQLDDAIAFWSRVVEDDGLSLRELSGDVYTSMIMSTSQNSQGETPHVDPYFLKDAANFFPEVSQRTRLFLAPTYHILRKASRTSEMNSDILWAQSIPLISNHEDLDNAIRHIKNSYGIRSQRKSVRQMIRSLIIASTLNPPSPPHASEDDQTILGTPAPSIPDRHAVEKGHLSPPPTASGLKFAPHDAEDRRLWFSYFEARDTALALFGQSNAGREAMEQIYKNHGALPHLRSQEGIDRDVRDMQKVIYGDDHIGMLELNEDGKTAKRIVVRNVSAATSDTSDISSNLVPLHNQVRWTTPLLRATPETIPPHLTSLPNPFPHAHMMLQPDSKMLPVLSGLENLLRQVGGEPWWLSEPDTSVNLLRTFIHHLRWNDAVDLARKIRRKQKFTAIMDAEILRAFNEIGDPMGALCFKMASGLFDGRIQDARTRKVPVGYTMPTD